MDIESVNSKANAGLTTGVIGTALAGLQALGGNWGLFGGNGNGVVNAAATMMCGDSAPVSRYEMKMAQELAKKDSEIALLKSEQNTEVKIADVYARLKGDLLTMERGQNAWNTQQAVNNAHMSDAIGALRDSCSRITKLVVPNSAICPGWGDVTITPAAPTAAETPTA